jgi:hypothetical protein
MDCQSRVKPPISSEERAERMEQKRWNAEQAPKERKQAAEAFRGNYERLKAESLAREAGKT